MSDAKIERTVTMGYYDLIKLEADKESAEHLVKVLRSSLVRDASDLDTARAALEKIAQIGDKANTQTDGGHPWLLVGNMAGIARDALKARKGMV